jgi:hypothetical protein
MNYLKIKNRVPFRSSFMYIDVPEYVADEVFENHGLIVRYKDTELYHKELDLVIVICSFFTFEEEIFFECMEHLKRRIAFLGYDMENYETMSEIFELIIRKYEALTE